METLLNSKLRLSQIMKKAEEYMDDEENILGIIIKR